MIRGAALLLFVAFAIAMGGCSDDSGINDPKATTTVSPEATRGVDDDTASATVPAEAPRGGDDAARVGACDPAREAVIGDPSGTLQHDGLERTYTVHIPPAYDGVARLPLVFNFHGFGSNARDQALYSGLPAKGDAEGFIVVSPNGTGERQSWNLALAITGGVDDISFVDALLDRLESELCIDSTRVYAVGMSNGAAFAQRVACAMPDRIAAVAAVTALSYPVTCGTNQPIPVIAFHGTADPCVPFEGGTSQCGAMYPVRSIEESARLWAEHNRCNEEPSLANVSKHVRTIAYSECAAEVAVVLFVVEGGGHTWPGAIDVPRLGPVTREINATDLIWEFFEGQAALR